MLLDLRDTGISKDLTFSDIREAASTDWMKSVLKEGDTVIDVGANIGYYALLEARAVGKTGHVYAIEPIPRNIELLRKNIEANGYDQVEVHQLAIGSANGTKPMYLNEMSNRHSLLQYSDTEVLGQIEVTANTLDTFFTGSSQVALVRMDVEGYEYEIIKGMKGLLDRGQVECLFIEVHPHIMAEDDTRGLLARLRETGFEAEFVAKRNEILNFSLKDLENSPEFVSGKLGGIQVFFRRSH